MKRSIAFLLALVLTISAIPMFATPASAATSSAVATAVSDRLPLVTYAMPLSGASKVYSYSNSTLSTPTTGYYIDSYKDQIVITQISSNGKAVYVTYPSSSSSTGFRARWFAADDILGLATVDIRSYTCSSSNTTYRMSAASGVTSYGSISKGDSCVMLGNHTVGGKTYYPTIYPISSQTINKVSGVRYKLAMGCYAPSNTMRDVTASFANKTITIKSVENGKYLCADSNASGTPLRANKDQAITWETFTVSALTSDGWVGFKAHNGKWLSAMADTTNTPIGAKYDGLYSWECFRIYQKGSDYYIKAQINDKWLCVRVDTDQAPVQAYASAASTWERLSIQVIDKNFWQWPMKQDNNGYKTTQAFNNYSSTMAANKGRPYHAGIDMVCTDKVIYAAADGTVVYRGYSSGNGNHIVIKHSFNGQTLYSLYSHLADYTGCPAVNSTVKKGTQIGTMGNTGNSTGAHLHFAIYTGGSTDPLGYVKNSGTNSIYYSNTTTFYNPAYVIEKNALP